MGKRLPDGSPKPDTDNGEINGYKNQRQRSRTLRDLQAHYDSVREKESKDYLRALAFAMNLTFREAEKASIQRAKEVEKKSRKVVAA